MNRHFSYQLATRKNLLAATESLSLEALNAIPHGFNNSIAWNLAHVLVTQQLLLYGMSGNECRIDDSFIARFRKGTKPEDAISQDDFDSLQELLISSVEWASEDYEQGIFTEYKDYTTSYGVKLSSIEDAIMFNNLHESMHLGYVMAMKRAI
ncbi:MAG: DinB family protein [Bacteroidia bacterium]|nr:DinB family protein [Bacteroidia bacterium]